jgi:hypothetical protein
VVWWATRENAPPPVAREVRFLGDVKTLVSVKETQLGMTALIDATVVQGEPAEFRIAIPKGFEVTGATGAALQSTDIQSGVLILSVGGSATRTYQFLVSLERAIGAASNAEIPFVTLQGVQRETGEVLVEGAGSMELTSKESGVLKRMDIRESSGYLRGLSNNTGLAAFRYHRQPTETPGLALEWRRFPDSILPAAVGQEAIVTTMVTSEGKSLTEVKIVLRNQAQPFLKIGLPAGSSILSADVAGEKVKPVEGSDGTRIPFLRPGFRPSDSYSVSFVFLHSGDPFANKGGGELVLP